MTYRYLVTVETDDAHLDAPGDWDIAHEIQNNLEWGQQEFGIVSVAVETYPVNPFTAPLSDGGDV